MHFEIIQFFVYDFIRKSVRCQEYKAFKAIIYVSRGNGRNAPVRTTLAPYGCLCRHLRLRRALSTLDVNNSDIPIFCSLCSFSYRNNVE